MRISDWSSDVCSSDLRQDYRPPDWLVPDITLDFALDAAATRVHATLSVTRNGDHDRPLRLDGDGLLPLQIRGDRSEEHTSELQSLMRSSYAAFCLTKKHTLQRRPSTTIDSSTHDST